MRVWVWSYRLEEGWKDDFRSCHLRHDRQSKKDEQNCLKRVLENVNMEVKGIAAREEMKKKNQVKEITEKE